METNDKHEAVSRIAGLGLVLVGLFATAISITTISRAQSNAPASVNIMKAPATTAIPAVAPAKISPSLAAKSSSHGPHDGINVHGYWTIEVRNPDGKVAKHMEFENQLCTTFTDPASGDTVPGGDTQISAMLVGNTVPGLWSIILGTQEPPTQTTGPGGQIFYTLAPNCAIIQQFSMTQSGYQGGATALAGAIGAPFSLSCSGNCFPVLNVPANYALYSASNLGPFTTAISLSGQFTVPGTGGPYMISAVGTDLFTCWDFANENNVPPITVSPAMCQNLGNYAQSSGTNNCSLYSNPGGGVNPNSFPTFTSINGCVPGLSSWRPTWPIAVLWSCPNRTERRPRSIPSFRRPNRGGYLDPQLPVTASPLRSN